MTQNQDSNGQQDIYIDDFDINKFKDIYDKDVSDLEFYLEKCNQNRDIRKNKWAGKSDDLKKHDDDAFPYKYASDTEVFTADRAIQNGVALCVNGMNRSQIRAYPRESTDVARAAEVSVMLKWMRDSGIKNFQRDMELAASYWFEKGLAITYCGWQKKNQSVTKTFDFEQMLQSIPELEEVEALQTQQFVELLSDEERIDELMNMFNEVEGWSVNEKRVKKALKQLRKDGSADIPIVIEDTGTFDVRTLAPDADVILPAYTMNVQDSPRVHMRMLLTGQDLVNYRETMDWDSEWVEHMIENHTGMSDSLFDSPQGTVSYNVNGRNTGSRTAADARDFIEVVFTYERLIDEEDGAEGIYLTVWSPKMASDDSILPSHAYRKLQSGRRSYPFVVTPLTYETKTLYESTTWPEILKAPQKTQKTILDNYIDEAQWGASPMMYGGPGVDLSQVGPGGRMNGPANRKPEFINKPQDFQPNISLEQIVDGQAMQHIGQSAEDPLSEIRQRHYVDSFLRRHVQNVLAMSYETFKLEGPDDLYFRVTGKPEGTQFVKNTEETEMDLCISFNSTFDDPEQLERISNVVKTAKQLSPSRVGSDEVADWLLSATDPMIADIILKPEAEGSARITDETASDIQRMSAGFAAGARTDAIDARIAIVQNYIQEQQQFEQQGIPTMFGQSQQFQILMDGYVKQMQQVKNQEVNRDEFGPLGARAAQVGNVNVQGIQDAE